MRFVTTFIRLALFALPVLASDDHDPHPTKCTEGAVLKGSYIVLLRDSASLDNVTGSIPHSNITAEWTIMKGFAATLTREDLKKLRARKDILSISKNAAAVARATQTDAPWGLQRISQQKPLPPTSDTLALNYTYIYDKNAGNGTDVYIIDTGIQIDHPQFTGRARWGATFGGYPDCDDNGHGTHCAGIVGSVQFGVSKAVSLVAVKVLGQDGCGWWSDVISGIDWVAKTAASTGRPSVASISLGSGAFEPADAAVANLIASGVPTTVASGDTGDNANLFSPGRVPTAVTTSGMALTSQAAQLTNYDTPDKDHAQVPVDSNTLVDLAAPGSNFGTSVKVFAPSVNIWSTWINSSSKVTSGSSTAAPFVAGFVANLLGMDPSLSPRAVEKVIDCFSTRDAIKLSRPAVDAGTPNRLLFTNHQEPHDKGSYDKGSYDKGSRDEPHNEQDDEYDDKDDDDYDDEHHKYCKSKVDH